jgi:hypothetical protein
MEQIDIQAHGIELDEKVRKHIMQRLHSVFGFNRYGVHKIIIRLYDNKGCSDNNEKCCSIEVRIRDQPAIITELKSLDVLMAVTLAIERANLKLSHRVKDDKSIREQINYDKNIFPARVYI